jgi:hypothetical protein
VITNALVEIKYPEGVDRMDKKKKKLTKRKNPLGEESHTSESFYENL